jgi:hypothetical protein
MEIRTIRAGGFAQAFAIQVLKAGHKVKLSNRSRQPPKNCQSTWAGRDGCLFK